MTASAIGYPLAIVAPIHPSDKEAKIVPNAGVRRRYQQWTGQDSTDAQNTAVTARPPATPAIQCPADRPAPDPACGTQLTAIEPWWMRASLRRWESLSTDFGSLTELVRAGFPIHVLEDTPVFDQLAAEWSDPA